MRAIPSSRYVLFFALAIVGCSIDLLTKHWMFTWSALDGGAVYWLWPGHAGFQCSLNEGALFGLGQGNVWFFAAMSVFAGIAIPFWLFCFGAARDVWLTAALGSVMAGVLGNLYDRLGLHGLSWQWPIERQNEPVYAVRDWILLQWDDSWRWPNFNVADSLLVVGACFLMLHAWRNPAP